MLESSLHIFTRYGGLVLDSDFLVLDSLLAINGSFVAMQVRARLELMAKMKIMAEKIIITNRAKKNEKFGIFCRASHPRVESVVPFSN